MDSSFSYKSLESKYGSWVDPMVQIEIEDNNLRENKKGLSVSDIDIELTCGFEANQCAFSLYDCYDLQESTFEYDRIKNYIAIGSKVVASAGYNMQMREVFRGVIVKVEFVIDDAMAPHVRVTAMDVKAIMMANHYHRSFTANSYSGAVSELMSQGVYANLQSPSGVITKLGVTSTPDALTVDANPDSDITIEMVGESDYEFVVRAAKKFNYEFFCVSGQVLFRPARGDVSTLMTFPNTTKVMNMNVCYDVTGLVGKVTVRGLDVGKAKPVESTKKNSNRISKKSMARSLIADSTYVYVDPTVTSKNDASLRADYLFEDMSYRFGTLDMEVMGVPEVIPGRFIELDGFGTVVSNTFYVREVHHHFDVDGLFTTRIVAQAQQLQMDFAGLL